MNVPGAETEKFCLKTSSWNAQHCTDGSCKYFKKGQENGAFTWQASDDSMRC